MGETKKERRPKLSGQPGGEPRGRKTGNPRSGRPKISEYTVRRLSIYSRLLEELENNRVEVVSSARLATLAGTNSAQVRKDLSYFGNFGKRGRGYQVIDLRVQIRSILGIDRRWKVLLVGAGNLGSALFSYKDFDRHGFRIVGILDNNPEKIGQVWDGVTIIAVSDCERVIRETGAEVAVIATPAVAAQELVETLSRAGICGFLNFAPKKLVVPPGTRVRNVNITIELEGLSFALQADAER